VPDRLVDPRAPKRAPARTGHKTPLLAATVGAGGIAARNIFTNLSAQRLLQIGDQVFDILQADGKTQQGIRKTASRRKRAGGA